MFSVTVAGNPEGSIEGGRNKIEDTGGQAEKKNMFAAITQVRIGENVECLPYFCTEYIKRIYIAVHFSDYITDLRSQSLLLQKATINPNIAFIPIRLIIISIWNSASCMRNEGNS